MPLYNVDLYREMRQLFRGIEANCPEDAARIADALTNSPDEIEDCEARTFSALVDLQGDAEYQHSKMIDFVCPNSSLLMNAAQRVIDNLATGDLAAAVRELDVVLQQARSIA